MISDWIVGAFGLCLAGSCAFLPWYVYNNPQNFGPPRMEFSGYNGGAAIYEPQDLAVRKARFRLKPDEPDLDRIVTGSTGADLDGPVDQPFPGDATYQLMFVAPGRALLHDGREMIFVKAGSGLPGGERIDSISQSDEGWKVSLDSGAVLEWTQ
ncbi:MAG: hypothetical protein OXR62_02185 [Ahrensia sp.]|nr:hypothetical protein [Ahrensia sp.]